MIRTLVIVAAAMLVAGGCSTKVRESGGQPGFDEALVAQPTVGIGSVAAAPTLGARLAPVDSLDAVEALYRSFLVEGKGIEVWQASLVADLADSAALASVSAEYARYGRLRPDHLTPLADHLAGCRFLAFGRLLDDRIDSDTSGPAGFNPEDRIEGQPERHSSWAGTVSVERKVRVAVEIFDLATGLSAWRGEADSKSSQLYEYEAADVSDLQERLAAPDGPTYIARRGDSLKAPDLIDLMQSAFAKLVGRLPTTES
jgi:hypothetical protein